MSVGNQRIYPFEHSAPGGGVYYSEGITYREELIARAMQGLLSNPEVHLSSWEVAKAATLHADAIIEQLDKEQKE